MVSLSNKLTTDKYPITVLLKVKCNSTFKRICRHLVLLNNESTYYNDENALVWTALWLLLLWLLEAVDDCASEASGRGLACSVRYSPEGTCFIAPMGPHVGKACVIYQSWRPSGLLFLLVNSLQPPIANLLLSILTSAFHLYRIYASTNTIVTCCVVLLISVILCSLLKSMLSKSWLDFMLVVWNSQWGVRGFAQICLKGERQWVVLKTTCMSTRGRSER